MDMSTKAVLGGSLGPFESLPAAAANLFQRLAVVGNETGQEGPRGQVGLELERVGRAFVYPGELGRTASDILALVFFTSHSHKPLSCFL